MVHRAGLRADALSSGDIVCGATVESVGPLVDRPFAASR